MFQMSGQKNNFGHIPGLNWGIIQKSEIHFEVEIVKYSPLIVFKEMKCEIFNGTIFSHKSGIFKFFIDDFLALIF